MCRENGGVDSETSREIKEGTRMEIITTDTIITAAIVIGTIIAAIIFSVVVIYLVSGEISFALNPPNPEYARFVEINAMCSCTAENVSHCQDRGICIHAYESCQRKQCPQCFTVPW